MGQQMLTLIALALRGSRAELQHREAELTVLLSAKNHQHGGHVHAPPPHCITGPRGAQAQGGADPPRWVAVPVVGMPRASVAGGAPSPFEASIYLGTGAHVCAPESGSRWRFPGKRPGRQSVG
jgi:hypothetical protein